MAVLMLAIAGKYEVEMCEVSNPNFCRRCFVLRLYMFSNIVA